MTVNFDLVRMGKLRTDSIALQMLKDNVQILQNTIRELLKDEEYIYGSGTMGLVMIIPARGFDIKIVLQDIGEERIKRILKHYLPGHSIYKGSYSTILDNVRKNIWTLD